MAPLFFIHGMWGRPSAFAVLRQELAAAGFTSVAPTLPLHDLPAGSPPPAALGALRLGDYVESLRRDLAALDEPPIVIGHSLGGLLAQLLVAAVGPEKVRGLALLATAPSAQVQVHALDPAALKAVWGMTMQWGWWAKPLMPVPGVLRTAVFNGVSEEEIRQGLAEVTWDSGAVLAQLAAPLLDPARGSRVDYARLQLPALVLTGLDDRMMPAAVSRATARHLGGAGARVDYEEWAGVGHWLFHDAVRPRLAAALSRFAASLG